MKEGPCKLFQQQQYQSRALFCHKHEGRLLNSEKIYSSILKQLVYCVYSRPTQHEKRLNSKLIGNISIGSVRRNCNFEIRKDIQRTVLM